MSIHGAPTVSIHALWVTMMAIIRALSDPVDASVHGPSPPSPPRYCQETALYYASTAFAALPQLQAAAASLDSRIQQV